jgi:hypothetical protein
MKIDGIIEEVLQDGGDIVLYLKGRKSDDAGIRQLRIKQFTVRPKLGCEIWAARSGLRDLG